MSRRKDNRYLLGAGLLVLSILFFAGPGCMELEPKWELVMYTDSVHESDGRYYFNGGLVSTGGELIEGHGFIWAKNPGLDFDDHSVNLGTMQGPAHFSVFVDTLSPGANYFVRAFVISDAQTVFGEELHFTTREGQVEVVPPILTTSMPGDITESTALGGGEITDTGGGTILARGLTWSAQGVPDIESSPYSESTNDALVFSASISGLQCGTSYLVRAWATNEAGTGYGDTARFATSACLANKPIVITSAPTGFDYQSAFCGGNVMDEGDSPVTARGVCWSTEELPTLEDDTTLNGSGPGTFQSHLTGLEASTKYYFRAYAINKQDTVYGAQMNFTTEDAPGGETVSDVEGNVYRTVQIGDQVWMAENLKTTKYADGTDLVDGTGKGGLASDRITRYYFAFDDNVANVVTHGRLYTWAAAVGGTVGSDAVPSGIQGVCPDGWHVPSEKEWQNLEIELGMSPADAAGPLDDFRGTDQGTQLKEGGTSGFDATLSGIRNQNGGFHFLNQLGYCWSATNSGINAYIETFDVDSTGVRRILWDKSHAFSVRCVKDE